jgi:hypothetical protein
VLAQQGFFLAEGVADHVAFGDAAEGGEGVPLGWRAAVGEVGEIAGEGVGDEAAAASVTGHDGGAFFQRGQPVDQVVGDRAVGELPDSGQEVLVGSAAAVGGVGGDGGVALTGHPRGQIKVVGGKIVDDSDVRDADGERPDAAGADLEDLAEEAVLQPGTQSDEGRVEAFDEPTVAGTPARSNASARWRAATSSDASGTGRFRRHSVTFGEAPPTR